ncbi:MAG TPA: hypothetical protein VGL15_12560 [Vicinamibacteria bacterium]|jgi:hypothetical protein
MYERRHQPLLPRRVFLRRLAGHTLAAAGLVGASLFIGMAGYHWLEALPWVDAFLNAAMILGGMGPVSSLHTTAGKLFAGCYALFAGTVFLVGVGVAFLPVVHRALHRFHLEADQGEA